MKMLSVIVLILTLVVGCTVPPESEAHLINVKGKEIREEGGNTRYIVHASTVNVYETGGKQCVIEGHVQEIDSVKGVYENIQKGKRYNVIIERTTGAIIQTVSKY